MPSKVDQKIEGLIQRVGEELTTFDDGKYPLLTVQREAFESCRKLLREVADDVPRQRRSERNRARGSLIDVYHCPGLEAFFLCAISGLSSKLERVEPRDFVPRLRRWWADKSCPLGLTLTATEVCHQYKVGELISPSRKRQHSTIEGVTGIPEAFHIQRHLSDLQIGDNLSPKRHRSDSEEHGVRSTQPTSSEDNSESGHNLMPLPMLTGNPKLPAESQYFSFSMTGRHMVEDLPEPFKTGIKTSNSWREEINSGGFAVTSCLSLSLPEKVHEDVLLQVKIGYNEGFHFFNWLGFGDPSFEI